MGSTYKAINGNVTLREVREICRSMSDCSNCEYSYMENDGIEEWDECYFGCTSYGWRFLEDEQEKTNE